MNCNHFNLKFILTFCIRVISHIGMKVHFLKYIFLIKFTNLLLVIL